MGIMFFLLMKVRLQLLFFYLSPKISITPPPIYFFQLSGGKKHIFQYLLYVAGKDVTLEKKKRKMCYPEFLVPASLASSSLAIPRSLEVFLPPALLFNFMSALNLDQATTDSIIPDYTQHSSNSLYFHMFESNKRQNGWTDLAQILCGTLHGPREGLWMIKISKICLHQNSIIFTNK